MLILMDTAFVIPAGSGYTGNLSITVTISAGECLLHGTILLIADLNVPDVIPSGKEGKTYLPVS